MKNRFEIMLEGLAGRKETVQFLIDAREGETVTYGEFLAKVREAARAFEHMGVKPGRPGFDNDGQQRGIRC